uniref:Si:dkey-85k7.12 n=1 Tax=Maylandia zebra TaxID=106582 RepID=A0A3P9D506_9CICH
QETVHLGMLGPGSHNVVVHHLAGKTRGTCQLQLMTLFYMFCSVFIFTVTKLENLMKDLDIEQYYREKLTLGRILEIDKMTITDEPAKSNSDFPWYFLKKLMMVNVAARNVKSLSNSDDMLNPLDIITTLFLCSDGFLQQEIALKMSMCQFSVPLLLPNCDTNQCTLMLWAMRDISKGFIEDRIVLSKLPMISFVRLGECSLSKSEILNKLLSNSQQYHDTFVHYNMECGDSPRRISNGLTEITWYLPCGRANIDIFSQPVAVANLHGDIESFETQYSFLCHTSAAIFVFFDYLDSLSAVYLATKTIRCLKEVATKLGLTKNIIIKTKSKNDADLVKDLRKTITDVQMADIAHELGILVDEDSPECQTAKTNAEAITEEIQDIHIFKEDQLPRRLQNYDTVHRCNIKPRNRENSENKEEIKEIDRQISNSSLGTEHFFREMGQIYEASLSLTQTDPARQQLQHLPKLCAELFLDGFPLELVDGDASNIPLRWVSDVLSQLSDLVSPNRKILVVTVLGVQMQFAVSSGRCTRGAFMLLIKINEDMKKVLNCDFMVIIDTEGLKSPELAQLDNNYEHDNELATLVVGLSDVTIVNIEMENSTEMKDILQIVVHAFLRMKEVGKKPKCEFVHQNVSDVSAHEKNLRDRKLLLEQLNEMTQAAAKMEKKEENKSFTDVMEYNPDTGNWYIPGLWNGNPPMAPVSAGYSEAVYELKKHIIQLLGNCESSANDISDFKEWMTSLWTAVKHENFIFSFRNNLGADAYMRLCTEFNKWECEFRKEMYTWVRNAETRISNFGTTADKSDKTSRNVTQYFKQTEGHVYLVEGYREEFSKSATSLRCEMKRTAFNQLTAAAEIREGMIKLDEIKKNDTKEIEKAVCALIDECRKKNIQMGETELENEFHKMWNETLQKLSFSEQKITNVFTSVSHCLRINLLHRGSHACELLSYKSLQDCGKEPFKYTPEGFIKNANRNSGICLEKKITNSCTKKADSIIDACTQFVREKVKRKNNYSDTYIQEILHIIDYKLKNNQDVQTDIEFEVSLKQHICGFAAREFQKMHEDFIQANDPYICLMKNKGRFREDFKDIFNKRDQCQKKAEEFTNRCLKPAVEDFISQSLGLTSLIKLEHFSTASIMSEFEDQRLQSCVIHINVAINKAKTGKSDDFMTFVEDICKELGDKLVISQDDLVSILQTLCSTASARGSGDNSFRCSATNNEWHPYKRYKEIFQDWKIPPDASLEASDYWKFIMAKYNNDFAKNGVQYLLISLQLGNKSQEIRQKKVSECRFTASKRNYILPPIL